VRLDPIEFDGDKVVFTVKRLLVEDMLVLSKHFDADKKKMVFASPMEVCKTASEVLPKYVLAIDGYSKAVGTALTVAEFLEAAKEFYFVQLVGELFGHMVSISTAGVQAKN
jgi:hypothetical protein